MTDDGDPRVPGPRPAPPGSPPPPSGRSSPCAPRSSATSNVRQPSGSARRRAAARRRGGCAGPFYLPQRGPVRDQRGARWAPPGIPTRPPWPTAQQRLQFGKPLARLPAHPARSWSNMAPGDPTRAPCSPCTSAGSRTPASLRTGPDLARQAEQRAGGASASPARPAPSSARRQRHHPGLLPAAARHQPWKPSAPTRAPTRSTPWSWASTLTRHPRLPLSPRMRPMMQVVTAEFSGSQHSGVSPSGLR